MPAVRRNALVLALWRLHRRVYRASGGRVGSRLGPWRVLLLETRGRTSGQPRAVTLNYFEDAGGLVVIASSAGDDRHPAWWLNLRAHPDAKVRLGGEARDVRAREVEGPERDRLWARLITIDPSYEVYRTRTSRRIPVVVLERRERRDTDR